MEKRLQIAEISSSVWSYSQLAVLPISNIYRTKLIKQQILL